MNAPPRFKYTRLQRLLTSTDYDRLFKTPDYRIGGKYLLLLAAEQNLVAGRLGVVVGKRKVKQAVYRNRIKRLSRETFRLRQHSLHGLDVLVLVKAPVKKADLECIPAELNRLWDKLLAKRTGA